MGRRVRILSALVAGTLAFVVGTSTAHAILKTDQYKCQTAIAKEGANYVNKKLKLIQKCKDANLATPLSCTAPDAAALQKLEDKLAQGLAKKCAFDSLGPGFDDDNLAALGFPGPCTDANPGNGFTLSDLQTCIQESHDRILSGVCGGGINLGEACTLLADCPDSGPGTFCRGIVSVEYDPTVVGPLIGTRLKCQREVAKNGGKFLATVLKNVQKCRNDLLNCKDQDGTTVCKLDGLTPQSCATNNEKTANAITKARDKAIAAIQSKCADPADVTALKLCDPDQPTATDAALCEVEVHQDLADNPDPAAVSDLIDYQYAQRGVCGDNRQNQISEECDGVADTACPGQCGGALGFFPCLCQNIPRTRVVEHANADLDNGWSGQSHDSGIVEGGGYVTDLWDCDGPGGPDTECVVGPSCNNPPHQACSPAPNATGAAANADSICTGVGNFCRKSAGGSTGPHCEIEFKKRCKLDSDCATAGDRCLTVEHGAPLPLVSGGVAVCVVNTFTEDVVGTTDLATGAGSVRLRQNSATFTGGDARQACPVCGGFCSGPASAFGPGVRNLCTTDADCTVGATCVQESICSWGPDRDQPCRPNPPGGGPTEFFGNPSRDCRMAGNLLGTIDILFNPATTATTSQTANIDCGPIAGFSNKVCAGGTNQHRACTVASECPGGTCNEQCFCPVGGNTSRPNGCEAACVIPGGVAPDGESCVIDDDCPGGFCHAADCRENLADTDSAQEGLCSAGPFDGRCSVNAFVNCNPNQGNIGCQGALCPFCEPGETCNTVQRQCFVNPTRERVGVPSLVPGDRISAALFCITATGSAAVDSVAGLPGPGAITQPTTTIEVGF